MNVPDDKSGIRAAWGGTVFRTVALQWAVVLILAAASWGLGGERAALSCLAGGAAVAIPNALFALWIRVRVSRVGSMAMTALLLGEFSKLGLTMALLVLAVVVMKREVVWLAFLVGVIGALKAQWLALWFTRNS